VKESNPRPEGRPGFRDRLRATRTTFLYRVGVARSASEDARALTALDPVEWLSRRDSNARPPPSDDGALSPLSYGTRNRSVRPALLRIKSGSGGSPGGDHDRSPTEAAQRRRLVRPGGLEPPTALQSGAHDGYKPSALPVELWARELVRMAGFEPAASSVRGKSSSGLSYILLALRREIESLSPDRQSGRLTRCVTEH
jgi:hypothetical protein